MTIKRKYKSSSRDSIIIFVCDDCGDDFDTGEYDFQAAYQMVKDCEWVARKEDDKWVHYCGDCR